jgi:hypothetical protein
MVGKEGYWNILRSEIMKAENMKNTENLGYKLKGKLR